MGEKKSEIFFKNFLDLYKNILNLKLDLRDKKYDEERNEREKQFFIKMEEYNKIRTNLNKEISELNIDVIHKINKI